MFRACVGGERPLGDCSRYHLARMVTPYPEYSEHYSCWSILLHCISLRPFLPRINQMKSNRIRLMALAGLIFAIISLVNVILCFVPLYHSSLQWIMTLTTIATPAASGFFAFTVFLFARSISLEGIQGEQGVAPQPAARSESDF